MPACPVAVYVFMGSFTAFQTAALITTAFFLFLKQNVLPDISTRIDKIHHYYSNTLNKGHEQYRKLLLWL